MYDIQAKSEYIKAGLILSAIGHFCFFYQIYLKTHRAENLPPKVIYSVSLESGKNIGGIAQVPDKKQKTEVAPPKKAEPKKTPPKKEVKKPEVVIPKERPKPVATPKPKPEPKPKKEQVKEVKPEATRAATPKPTKAPKKETQKKQADESYQDALQKYLGESTKAGGTGFGSAGKGGKGMGGGVVKSPEWFRYREELEVHLKRGWNWHDSAHTLLASVRMEIDPEGKLSNVRIIQTSGDRKFDDSVLRAVHKADPVPIAPESVYPDFRDVVIDFEPGGF